MLLQHIIGDLQDLATADAGRLRLYREPVRVADLLSQVRAAHRVRAEGAGIALSTAVADELELYADPVRLRQAVENLVTNALRHTPEGGSVRLGAGRDGDVVVIEIADTGTGISAEELTHIFDRFWRAEKSRSRQTGGSGLGLAIVRKLAEAHGGTVTVASAPGQGSTFALRLPDRLPTATEP
jgi:two-component system sensor histidine kinase BaeS